jgi:hypothetical protein
MNLTQERFKEILFYTSAWGDIFVAVVVAAVTATVLVISGNTLTFAVSTGVIMGLLFAAIRLLIRLVWK